MAGKFVVIRMTNGQFRFNLKARNGETIATSESYKTKAAALKGIESVKTNAATASTVDESD